LVETQFVGGPARPQLKEPAQLDDWRRDDSAASAESLCEWE
jgi:hypothetical protein